MNLLELKKKTDEALEHAIECGELPQEILVSLQIDSSGGKSVHSCHDVELHYDNNIQASGCVLTALVEVI